MQKTLKRMYNENIVKWFYVLFPFIEVLTTYTIINTNFKLTLGMIYKISFLGYAIFYLLFVDKRKQKYNYLILGLFLLSIMMNVIVTTNFNSLNILFNKAFEVSKYICFPVTMLFLYKYMKNGNKISFKTLLYSGTIYALVMILAKITGTELATYNGDTTTGHKGWFYSGNELSGLLTLFFPISIYYFSKYREKIMIISLASITYGLLAIGTKTAFIAMITSLSIFAISNLIILVTKKTDLSKRILTTTLLLAFIILILGPYSSSQKFISIRFEKAKKVEPPEGEEAAAVIETFIFNGREYDLKRQGKIFNEASVMQKMFGLNLEDRHFQDNGKIDVIERDIYDILFTYGYFGITVYFVPMIIMCIIFAKRILINFKKEFNEKNIMIGTSIFLLLAISYIAGHVLLAPTVAMFLSLMFIKLNEPEKLKVKEKKKMIIYMPKISVGGMEIALINLLRLSDYSKNYDITLKVGYVVDKDLIKRIPSDITINYMCKSNWNTFGKIKAALKYIIEYISLIEIDKKYDVSICYSYHHAALAKLSRLASRNNSIFIHSDLKKARTEIQIKKINFEKFNKVVCVSESAKKTFKEIFPKYLGEVVVANNYIDGSVILKLSKEKIDRKEKINQYKKPIFINVSRHKESVKKISRLIEVSERLKLEGYQFTICLVGDGENKSDYEKSVKEKKINDVVKFLGKKTNPYKYIKKSDALLLVSDFEGYGIVLDEARVLGIPIITTNVGDAKIITEEGYGILCETSLQGVYEGMKKFLDEGYKIQNEFNYKEFNNKITQTLNNMI